MAPPVTTGESFPKKRRRRLTTVEHLDADILCILFSFLDLFDLVRCTVVCKSWYATIKRFSVLQAWCQKTQQDFSSFSTSSQLSRRFDPEDIAMRHHRLSLLRGKIDLDRWKGHSLRVAQCRMKMGSILTGGGDKVVRLWSSDSYKCKEEYSLPDSVSLVDFDFDESKIVGLLGTRLCIWRQHGNRSIFPTREGTFAKGLCMRYNDPDAVVGCEDGTACVFDMYSRKCSQIIRTHAGPITCLSLTDDQLILSGSAVGSVTVSDPSANHQAIKLKSANSTGGIKTMCFNPLSSLVFAGTTGGYISCWDLRKMQRLWENRACSNVVYSLQHQQSDRSTLVTGGIDGVLRILDQNTGELLACCVAGEAANGPTKIKGRRISEDMRMDDIPRAARPPITCLAVGLKKVVTTHNEKYISMWNFNT